MKAPQAIVAAGHVPPSFCNFVCGTFHFEMDISEGRLAKQVCLYRYLGDHFMRDARDNHISSNSLREIASTQAKNDAYCLRKWKNLRDCLVKAKRGTSTKSGDPGGDKEVPLVLEELGWLSQFITHRESGSYLDVERQ